jgi:cation:H+ antiporter
MIITVLLLIAGLILLISGAEFMVRGASSISRKAGIPPLVVGLTIVAFGTSAPELIVNVFSALNGNTDIALGNILGSNVSNILLILGLSALITTLKVQQSTTWKEIPFSMLAIVSVLIMGNDILLDGGLTNSITRTEGLVLIGFFVVFMYYSAGLMRDGVVDDAQNEIRVYKLPIAATMTIGGLLGLFFGGKMLVENAVFIAREAGMSEIMIGLTIVAIGTSMPELATSLIAAFRKQADIAVGNVVGSNIFNTFWILGVTSTIKPIPVTSAAQVDIMVCVGATLALFLVMFIGPRHTLSKWEGMIFLLGYIAYMGFVVVRG